MAAGEDTKSVDLAGPVMTLGEVARYLKVSEKTILRMVQGRRLPGVKVSNQWRFVRTAIDDWLNAGMQGGPRDVLRNEPRTEPQPWALPALVSPGRVLMPLEPGPKRDVLHRLIAPLVNDGVVADPGRYLAALLARERMASTAIGDGVAVPHAREPEDSGLRESGIVLGICPPGMDFDALDGSPTRLFFLVGSTSTEIHLRLMARTMMMLRMSGVKEALLEAPDAEAACAVLLKTHAKGSEQITSNKEGKYV